MLVALIVAQAVVMSDGFARLGLEEAETRMAARQASPSEFPEEIERIHGAASNRVGVDASAGASASASEAGKGINITNGVFSQVEDKNSGIYFTYRVGPSPLVGFGISEVYYQLGNETLELAFPGSRVVEPKGINPLQSVTSYFRGNDPSKWQAGLVDYGAIVYEDLYPGIDLTYKTTGVGLKYEFLVAPGMDTSQICLDFMNADVVDARSHDLRISIAGAVLEDRGLIAFQDITQKTNAVDCEFHQSSATSIRFLLGDYDSSKTLTIDPVVNVLGYSTFLGEAGSDRGRGIVVENGYAFVFGKTSSPYYPTTVGAYNTTKNGLDDVFVTKMSVDGSSLIYSTFIGGSVDDVAADIAVENGFAYVTGCTYNGEPDYPTTPGAYDTTFNSSIDIFVTKLGVDGSTLVYSTFIGTTGMECGMDIAVENGFAYVTGYTSSSAYPTTPGAYDTTYNGGLYDAFVMKLSTDGSSLIYSTLLGGSSYESTSRIAVEGGIACVVGTTNDTTTDYPTTTGAYDRA